MIRAYCTTKTKTKATGSWKLITHDETSHWLTQMQDHEGVLMQPEHFTEQSTGEGQIPKSLDL